MVVVDGVPMHCSSVSFAFAAAISLFPRASIVWRTKACWTNRGFVKPRLWHIVVFHDCWHQAPPVARMGAVEDTLVNLDEAVGLRRCDGVWGQSLSQFPHRRCCEKQHLNIYNYITNISSVPAMMVDITSSLQIGADRFRSHQLGIYNWVVKPPTKQQC